MQANRHCGQPLTLDNCAVKSNVHGPQSTAHIQQKKCDHEAHEEMDTKSKVQLPVVTPTMILFLSLPSTVD